MSKYHLTWPRKGVMTHSPRWKFISVLKYAGILLCCALYFSLSVCVRIICICICVWWMWVRAYSYYGVYVNIKAQLQVLVLVFQLVLWLCLFVLCHSATYTMLSGDLGNPAVTTYHLAVVELRLQMCATFLCFMWAWGFTLISSYLHAVRVLSHLLTPCSARILNLSYAWAERCKKLHFLIAIQVKFENKIVIHLTFFLKDVQAKFSFTYWTTFSHFQTS